MKLRKFLAVMMACVLAFSFTACGSQESDDADAVVTPAASNEDSSAEGTEDTKAWSYTSIKLGEEYTDLTATLKFFHNKTDRDINSGGDGKLQEYIAEFNKVYPNITVETESVTNYADEALLRLSTGDWGDIMFMPAVDSSDFATYFMPYGTVDEMNQVINYVNGKAYEGISYGVPYMGTANGLLYNKAVFAQAGITTLPKTPDEFIADLQLIKDNTDAIPLYTNYFAGWPMGAWDAYSDAAVTGDFTYQNQKFVHTANPFTDPGDGTGAYNLYKVLYDAVANDLIEDDYTTTDWESSKPKLNNGEIATMVLGSWSITQMQTAPGGEHPEDVGYMPFPITVDGKQYVVATGDYNYGINVNSSDDNKLASTIFVKWMTEESGWSYDEGGLPASKNGEIPVIYEAFADCVLLENDAALPGEEDLLSQMNAESELNFNNGGDAKVQKIIEDADTGAKTFDEIMAEWNQKWTDAQETLGIEVLY